MEGGLLGVDAWEEQRNLFMKIVSEGLLQQTKAIEQLAAQQQVLEAEVRRSLRGGEERRRQTCINRKTVKPNPHFPNGESTRRPQFRISAVETIPVEMIPTKEQSAQGPVDPHKRRHTALMNLRKLTVQAQGKNTARHHFDEAREAWSSCVAAFTHSLQCRAGPVSGTFRKSLQRVVRCAAFEFFFGMFILANTVLIGVETEYAVHHTEDSAVLRSLQLMFGIVFTVELALRICAEGTQFLLGETRSWNLFDSLLVIVFLLDYIVVWGRARSAGSTRILRAVRFCRILRTARIMKVSTYAFEFRKMAYALQFSALTLFWAILLLFSTMYVFAVVFTQATTEHLQDIQERGVHNVLEYEEDLRKYWGTLSASLFSLYGSLTGGWSWGDLLAPLSECGWIWQGFFLGYIALTTFGVVNVVTSIFVESAMASQQYFIDIRMQDALNAKKMHMRHLIDFFDALDADGSGTVTFQELQLLLDDAHFLVYLESIDRHGAEVQELFQLLDADGSGNITIDEFCDGFFKLKGEAKNFDVHRLSYQTIEHLNLLQKVTRRTQTRVQGMETMLAELTGHTELLEPDHLQNSGYAAAII